MKVSFIATVYNEEKTIESFVESILKQTKLPDEIIIIDGGSSDKTVKKVNDLRLKSKELKGKFKVVVKKGNRSVGRNKAVQLARYNVIVCADAGTILDKDWVKQITAPFQEASSRQARTGNSVDVVAGYYQGVGKTVLQKCVIPYALVMPDQVNPDTFLPATRSMAFTKAIWKKAGGFPEEYSHNEDYVFAKRLRKIGATIVFAKDAIVHWIPRSTLRQTWLMMYIYAFGDAEAYIIRPKVIILFVRYLIGLFLLLLFLFTKQITISSMIVVLLLCYFVWAIRKNYRYVKDPQAIIILPVLQLVADSAVLIGTIFGLVKRL